MNRYKSNDCLQLSSWTVNRMEIKEEDILLFAIVYVVINDNKQRRCISSVNNFFMKTRFIKCIIYPKKDLQIEEKVGYMKYIRMRQEDLESISTLIRPFTTKSYITISPYYEHVYIML